MVILFRFLIALALLLPITLAAELYVGHHGDLYFVAEKVDDNLASWLTYQREAFNKNDNGQSGLSLITGGLIKKENTPVLLKKFVDNKSDAEITKQYELFKGAADGLSNFGNALRNVTNSGNAQSDVWVTYVTTENPERFSPTRSVSAMEMAMAVIVKPGSPVVMHMGIARNPFNLFEKENQHPRISHLLHAFAAKVILTAYAKATHLITTPLGSMAKLLRDVLPEGSYAEGMNEPKTWVEQSVRQDNRTYPSDFLKPNYKLALYDRDIMNPDRKLILQIDDNNKQQYIWLLNRLHISLKDHPYFAANLESLAKLFPDNVVHIPN